ncbi:MAG: hypothetical protein ACAF41_19055 [Leptolyngbya sp. BL-A-14]
MDIDSARTDKVSIDIYSADLFERLFGFYQLDILVDIKALEKPEVVLYFFHSYSIEEYDYLPQESKFLRSDAELSNYDEDYNANTKNSVNDNYFFNEGTSRYEHALKAIAMLIAARTLLMPKRYIAIELLDGKRGYIRGVCNVGMLLEEELKPVLAIVLQKIREVFHLSVNWYTQIYTLDLDTFDPLRVGLIDEHNRTATIRCSLPMYRRQRLSGTWSQIWAYKSFSARLLAIYTNLDHKDAVDFLRKLEELEFVQLENYDQNSIRVKNHVYQPNSALKTYILPTECVIFILTLSSSSSAVKNEYSILALYQYAWSSMRIYRIFSINEIKSATNTDDCCIEDYVLQLQRAGYLKLLKPEIAPNSSSLVKKYKLVKNSGPLAPISIHENLVYDLNSQSLHKSKL